MLKITALAALAIGSSVLSAQAAVVYATAVVDTARNGTVTGPARSNPANALGAADDAFYSLGLGGSITLDFGRTVGGKGTLSEVTYNPTGYYEYAELFTSLDGLTWASLGTVFNGDAVNTVELFAATPFRYLTLVDTSPVVRGRDGFDLDSVGFTPVPLPAAGLALATGLVGLGSLRRRR